MKIKKHTKQWWENFWASSQYDFGEPRVEFLDFAKKYRERSPEKNLKSIDVGSGNGRYAIPLAQLGYSSFAVEITRSGCNTIQKNADKKTVALTILQSDIKDLVNHDGGQFDFVLSSGLMEEIAMQDQKNVVKHIKKLCKINGILILKYCLEITERGTTVEAGTIPPLFFRDNAWKIIQTKTDPSLRDSIGNLDFEDKIRTETIIAKRIK